MEDDLGDGEVTRARSKSPLVNSAERIKKCHRTDTPITLASIPTFPAIIPRDKGNGGEVGKGNGKGGHKGKGSENAGGGGDSSDSSGGGGEDGGGGKGGAHGGHKKERTHGVEAAGEGNGRTRGAGSEGMRGTEGGMGKILKMRLVRGPRELWMYLLVFLLRWPR